MRPRLTTRVLGVCAAFGLAFAGAGAQGPPPDSLHVYVVPIDGTIDLGLAPFLARALGDAARTNAAAVVLEINTFGGRVDAAVAMRDAILASPVRTIGFINPRAISAGALIALATDTIVIAEGGTIGAATPIVGGTGPPQAADEKTISYVRKEFAATAERRHRPSLVAQAMVDPDVEIEGLVAKGKLLTLTSSEALETKIAELSANTLEQALAATGLGGATIERQHQSWAEAFVRFLTNPIVSSLLMTVGLLGVLLEIRTPGFTVPGLVGVLCLGLFFWGHWIVQLAGWEELLLVAIGIGLLGFEIFVIPGFGIAGIAGIAALVAGLGLTLVGAGATTAIVVNAFGRVAISILLALGLGLAALRLLPVLPFGSHLVLEADMKAAQGFASPPPDDRRWIGRTGVAHSPLRPAGIADMDGTRLDVVSEGGFIEAGAAIEVTRVDGNRIVVRTITHQTRNGLPS
jgi:membrane-bound serine protease (ClpP class)